MCILWCQYVYIFEVSVHTNAPDIHPAAEMEDEMSDGKHKQACITEQTQYFFADDRLSFSGNFDCLNCSR